MSGQEEFINGRCLGCKDVTRHLILTEQDGKPKLAQCSQCNDEHKYKPPPPTKAEKDLIAAERLKAKREAADKERWSQMRPGMIEGKAKDYSMDGLFRKKDIICHPVFGLGFVEKKAGPRKIEVLFEDGLKVMRCQ